MMRMVRMMEMVMMKRLYASRQPRSSLEDVFTDVLGFYWECVGGGGGVEEEEWRRSGGGVGVSSRLRTCCLERCSCYDISVTES